VSVLFRTPCRDHHLARSVAALVLAVRRALVASRWRPRGHRRRARRRRGTAHEL